MLKINEFEVGLFEQSKNNDEGLTEQKKVNKEVMIPACNFQPILFDVGTNNYFDRSDGCYSFLNAHTAALPLVFEEGTIIEEIKVFSENTALDVDIFASNDTSVETIQNNASTNTWIKINKVVTNGQKIWMEISNASGQIKRILIKLSK